MSRARKQDRFSSTLAVSYREPTSGEPSLGTCSDISPSGMFIETTRPAARGVLVRFECVSQSTQGVVRGTARVMWLRPHSEAQGKAGMGVRFVRLEPGSARVIEELISRASSAGSRAKSDGPEARATTEEPSVVLTAERTIGPTNRSSSVPPKGLRAPTLRGMHAADVRSMSSNPPPPKERKSFDSGPPREPHEAAGRTNAPPSERAPEQTPEHAREAERSNDAERRSSRPPGETAGAHAQALRERLDRARRLDETPTTSHRQPDDRSDPKADDRATAPDGSMLDPQREKPLVVPSKGLGATMHDASSGIPAKLSMSAGARRGSDNTMGVPSPPPPPWKARHSERPPEPGGVEVIRAVHVTAEEQAVAAAAAATAARQVVGAPNGRPEQAAVHAELPGANDPALSDWQPMVDPARPAMRPDRTPPHISVPYMLPATTDEAQAKPGRNWIPWIVVGSGLAVTLVLTMAMGGIKLSAKQVTAKSEEAGATDQLSAENTFAAPKEEPTADDQKGEPTKLVIATYVQPLGATVTALGTTITSPGKLSFPTEMVQWPLRVRVAMDGYGGSELALPRQVFATEGDALTYELHLALQPVPAAIPPATAPAAAAPAPRPSSKPEPRRSNPPKAPKAPQAPAPGIAGAAPPGASTAPEAPAAAAGSAKTPFQRALECLSRGDNACVITALASASGARELDLLIETYRATGDASSAEATMRRYLQLHADGKRASQYRRALGIAAPTASETP